MAADAANDDVPRPPAETIGARLRRLEPVSDEAFDALLSELPRRKSRSYWSSVEACQTAARLLREAGATRVLDAGSGVGKFCVIASLHLGQKVFGVERRGELLSEARRLARTLGADVELTLGTFEAVEPTRFNGFYFFNPFGEYVADDEDRYDLTTPRSFDAYIKDARLVERWLRAVPVGTAMVTYNGLGGRIPASYRVRHTTHVRDDVMRLWVKEQPDASREAFIEIEEELMTASELAALARTRGRGFSDSPLVQVLSTPEEGAP